MEYATLVDAVESDMEALVAAMRSGPLDSRVPTCPEFDVARLSQHIGEFTGFWTHVLCEGTGRPKTPAPDPPAPDGLADWIEGLARHLVTELRATPPDTEIWTWDPDDKSAAFAARRCAHELAVHRVDVQLAHGPADPVDAAIAVDGIDEVFAMVKRGGPDGRHSDAGAGETLHLHGIDHEAEWLVTLRAGDVDVTREHAKGDLALKGSVSDLEMLLYQRPTVGTVERFGDESVLATFHDIFTFG